MKLEIKRIDSPDFDLKNFPKDKEDNFCMLATVSIGFSGESSSDDFDINVYSFKWLLDNALLPMNMHASILMKKFDFNDLIFCINETLEKCNDVSKEQSMKNVSKYFVWEFEGYS